MKAHCFNGVAPAGEPKGSDGGPRPAAPSEGSSLALHLELDDVSSPGAVQEEKAAAESERTSAVPSSAPDADDELKPG
eukprot:CAMPEP_0198593228 /NCGR_PEP_ID=MMETSP1462-20131121/139111_1 /TAXON_ID=1333877 /ORGANISM="Brandtodinium nutriculum, Strain RCC3387" /LENGTH=77 /DNA_ID=CAMNT_0044324829 /DNA_START=1 /DNA_END=230 /DNA_ORIENTATION=+